MRIIYFVLGLITLCCVSCQGFSEKDRSRLAEGASSGDVNAMKVIYYYKNKVHDKPIVTDQQYNSFNQKLLDQGYSKIWVDKIFQIRKEGAEESEAVRMAIEAAEKGCVPCMDDLALYYHKKETPGDNEKAIYWAQMAADSSSALAEMRLLRWQDKNIYMPTRAIKVGKEGWKIVHEGNLLGQLTSGIVFFVSTYFVDIFKFTFSTTTWWQGLLGFLVFIIFFGGIAGFPAIIKDAFDVRTQLPFYWTLLYGGINGLVVVIDEFKGFVSGSWIEGENFVTLNIGRFTYAPYSCTILADICIYATWIWLIGIIGMTIYLYSVGAIREKGRFAFVLFSIIMAYIYGVSLSLLSIVAAVICVLMVIAAVPAGGSTSSVRSSSSNSSSNSEDWEASITDEYGGTRKLKSTGIGTYVDDEGRRWKDSGYNEVERDNSI